MEPIKPAAAAEAQHDAALAQLGAGLPLAERLHMQCLLIDLGAEIDTRGVELIVPGKDLSSPTAVQSSRPGTTPLAKVAELIDAFDQPEC